MFDVLEPLPHSDSDAVIDTPKDIARRYLVPQIQQFTCPFPKVAGENSCACSMDVEFVRQLVGADARLTTSLLRDDGVCTFRIRPVEVSAGSRR